LGATIIKLDFIDLGKLSIAKINMRHKGKDPDIADIRPSIAKRGVRMPLRVRPNDAAGVMKSSRGGRRRAARPPGIAGMARMA
jgi:ParB family chromosome partitioning protein